MLHTYLFILMFSPLCAQEYSLSYNHWGPKDGLSDRWVNDLCEDRKGLIWICTKNGLNCFDGYSFKVFNKENSQLPFDDINAAVADAAGNLWFLGANLTKNNIVVFDPVTRMVTSLPDKTGRAETITANFLKKVGDSTLLFGNTGKQTFYAWHPTKGLKNVRLPIRIRSLLDVTENSTLLVESWQREVCEIDLDGTILRKTDVSFITSDSYGYLPHYGLFVEDSSTEEIFHISPSLKISNVSDALPPKTTNTRDYVAYVGVDSFIWRQGILWHPKTGIFRDFSKEAAYTFRQKFVEKNGRIWAYSHFGLDMLTLKKSKFQKYFYSTEDSNFNNSCRNIALYDSCIYTVNEFCGLRQQDIRSKNPVKMQFDRPGYSRGYVLISTRDGGLLGLQSKYSYSLQQGSNVWALRKMPASFSRYKCWSLLQVSTDSFLVGTNYGLVWYMRRDNTFSPFAGYGTYQEMLQSHVTDISIDKYGQGWIVSNSGLYAYDLERGITARYSAADTGNHYLPAKGFHCLYQDADSVYWLGTEAGLLKWERNKNTYKLYTRKDGLSNNNIYAIYEDRHRRLWLSSDYGIMQFTKATANTQAFTIDAGITDNEFNRTSHYQDSSGNIYFGSLNGITSFNPEDFPVQENLNELPSLVVTSFEQFDGDANDIEDKTAALRNSNTITLQPGDQFFRLNFSLLNFADAIHNTYYWQIDGIDKDWNITRDHSLRLSGLPYGSYQLQIKGQASDGSWGGNDLHFTVIVLKPFYLHSWFILLCIVATISAFVVWYRLRVYHLKKENERLDDTVKAKTKALEETINDLKISTTQKDVLLKEIHHRVKNNIQVISSLLKMELANVADANARKSIEEGISRISSIGLIHQHLYKGEDLTSIEFDEFVSELNKQVAGIYQQRGQSVSFRKEIPKVLMDIDTALPLGLILNELMTNSYKYTYTPGVDNRLTISLREDTGHYVLGYKDFGPGLPEGYEKTDSGSLGMLIINGLTKQLGGYFTYDREQNTFVVYFKDIATRKKNA